MPQTPPRDFIEVDSPRGLDDLWAGEGAAQSDRPIDSMPTFFLEQWVGDLADRVEVQRLVEMGALVPGAGCHGSITGKLTTKFETV